ncbi:homocysteine S-methyltransferase family protein [Seohaeicola nanhaiensis]|uniref:Homocysteine S-methyltransferase family protein n=1 Tax=Seohaeicola nanhaiensis TaxID=1387282 RepID=A0ABV9KFT4_9RHOB
MSDITLLDGSIGQELVRRADVMDQRLWSTRVLIDHPEMVGALHREYFAAGATIATANSYALHRSRLAPLGMEGDLPALLDSALTQAETARADHGSGRIAGALGPLLASYRPDLDPDPGIAAPRFHEVAAVMAPRVDILLIETVSSLREAEGALKGVSDLGKPVWIGFTVTDADGTRLRSGEPLAEIAPLLRDFAPEAVLINCSPPEVIAAALDILAPMGLPFGAYANGFTRISEDFLKDAPTVASLERRSDLTPAAYADQAMTWIDHGATILGGCCEVGPAHIAELARRLRAAGHRIV